MDGERSSVPNFGPRAVQSTASTPRASDQTGKSAMHTGALFPRCQEPMSEGQVLSLMPSRLHRALVASDRSTEVICAHRTLKGAAAESITRVMRPSDDWRVNSTGAK